MNDKEQIALLKIQKAELKKKNASYKKQLKAAKERTEELEEDLEVLSRAVRSGKEKLRLELFLKFGSSSEKYRKLFNIPIELLETKEEELSEQEKQLLAEAKAAVERTKDTEKKSTSSRNRHPEGRKGSTGGGRQSFDPSYPRDRKDFILPEYLEICT